ncbi:MAG: L-lactate permease, partial [Proteobacteria bacterium]|nr:L-lactate permease [Pseudomonadota bacterium]
VGLGTGLSADPDMAEFATSLGFERWDLFLANIAARVALIHAIAGTFIPLLVVATMTRFFGTKRSFAEGLEVWRFALFAAFSMTIPYLLVATFLGPEFPSMFGGLIGLAIVVPAAKRGFLMPAKEREWRFPERAVWEPDWSSTLAAPANKEDDDSAPRMSLLRAWSPYFVIAVLLVITRLRVLDLESVLRSAHPFITWAWPQIFGSSISASFQPLWSPGSIFILASFITIGLHKLPFAQFSRGVGDSLKTLAPASMALIFTVPMVQVFINSSDGAAGFEQMPLALAEGVAVLTGAAWPLFSPFIGGLGAFVAGSNTVSNMMFSLFQFGVGERIGYDPLWIVALQAVGGAAGNIICVHNVVAASAVVGLVGKEGAVIRKTLLAFVYYALFTGAIGLGIVNLANGFLNTGFFLAAAIAACFVFAIARARPTTLP